MSELRPDSPIQRPDTARPRQDTPADVAPPTLEELELPPILKDVVMNKRGIVIVVGGTGSGKSTTLAAMIGHRNENSRGHIVSIEDPVEYVHPHKGCVITQREVGIDTESWHNALKNTLRQAPDVILIGEIRDRDTMEHAIAFAETGHLAISTLHANNANQALDRIINFFPEERRNQLLLDLSLNLRAFVSQRLVPTVDGKRCAAVEILLGTPLAWWLARSRHRARLVVEALVALPLVLPPTVLGFYLLIALSPQGMIGKVAAGLGLQPLAFSFSGLVIGSVFYSLPFVVQPLRDAFATIGSVGTLLAALALFTPETTVAALYYTLHSTLAGALLGLGDALVAQLLLGRLDEAAGIHYNQVRILIGSDRLVSLRPKLSQDPLGVHKGFRTAKADEANPARSVVVQVPFLIEDRLS